jgi:hypothetical protein
MLIKINIIDLYKAQHKKKNKISPGTHCTGGWVDLGAYHYSQITQSFHDL